MNITTLTEKLRTIKIVPVIALEGQESVLTPVSSGQLVEAGDSLMTWA